MKRKDIKQLHAKDIAELTIGLKEAQEKLFKLRMDQKMMKIKDTRSLFELRKDIARTLTVISEKGAQA